jgi:hypothetical protein
VPPCDITLACRSQQRSDCGHGLKAAQDADDHIVYNLANGWLIYDVNGSAPGGATHFARLVSGLSISNTDFLVVA